MILAALLLLATIISTWFCYWFLRAFSSVWNRASQIASLVCPAVVALIFAAFASTVLGSSGMDIDFPTGWRGREIKALVLGFAIFITAPSLAIAWIAGSWSSKGSSKGQRQ